MRERKQEILRGLEAMRENLEAFADEMWDIVDPHDMSMLSARVATYQDYTRCVADFGVLADQLATHLASVPDTPPLPTTTTPSKAPHTLSDDFTFMKPAYYVLRVQQSAPQVNWTELYADVCRALAQANPAEAAALITDSHYTTIYGSRRFSETGAVFARSRQIAPGIYANVGLSANALRDLMCQLLPDFGLIVEDMVVYFAEK